MSNCILIREARLEDIKRIVEIEQRSFKYPYPSLAFITILNLYPKYFLVCEYCGEVVGYVMAVIDKDGYGHIMSIAVDPNHRGLGLGRRLMEAVESRLSADGIKRFRLEVAVSNHIAIRMYEGLGYRAIKVLRNYYPDGEDAYVMVKNLTY